MRKENNSETNEQSADDRENVDSTEMCFGWNGIKHGTQTQQCNGNGE